MKSLVVDASVLAPALLDDNVAGDRARAALAGHDLVAPELIDLEVVSVMRRQLRANSLERRRADLALADLLVIPIRRIGHCKLLQRCWELREGFSAYDAAYVALADLLDLTLMTADKRLAHSPGLVCDVELLG